MQAPAEAAATLREAFESAKAGTTSASSGLWADDNEMDEDARFEPDVWSEQPNPWRPHEPQLFQEAFDRLMVKRRAAMRPAAGGRGGGGARGGGGGGAWQPVRGRGGRGR